MRRITSMLAAVVLAWAGAPWSGAASAAHVFQPEARADQADAAPRSQQRRVEWTIDGVKREAIIAFPAEPAKRKGEGEPQTDKPEAKARNAGAPVVFAFHGHGGTARHAARTFAYHTHWPEAICVYMQGLPTPGALTDPEGKRPGWQKTLGDQDDRDLKFFDAVLATLRKEHHIDDARIYAAGHSNGGAFTYLLWAERHEVLAAVAPSGSGTRDPASLKPLPAMHIAGTKDPLVPFRFQKRNIDAVRKVNRCAAEGEPWAKDCEIYESPTGTPLVTMILPGAGHEFPDQARPLIVRFFKEHRKRATTPSPAGDPRPSSR